MSHFENRSLRENSARRKAHSRKKTRSTIPVFRDANGNIVEQKNWKAELSLDDLRKITDKFIDLLLKQTAA